MRKTVFFFIIILAMGIMLPSCEKPIIDEFPIMRSFYSESVGLPTVSLDSINSFSSKVNGYVSENPLAKEHHLYPKILDNIKSAKLKITLTIDDSWAGYDTIRF